MNKQPTVSLVLGSGAARGLAHIGVIEWLNSHGYRIDSIAGASMGALVGGIYAAGELDSYKAWVLALEKMDVIRFLDLAFSSEGLFKGDRLIDVLRGMVGDHNIEDLPVSYTAVACDLDRQPGGVVHGWLVVRCDSRLNCHSQCVYAAPLSSYETA